MSRSRCLSGLGDFGFESSWSHAGDSGFKVLSVISFLKSQGYSFFHDAGLWDVMEGFGVSRALACVLLSLFCLGLKMSRGADFGVPEHLLPSSFQGNCTSPLEASRPF